MQCASQALAARGRISQASRAARWAEASRQVRSRKTAGLPAAHDICDLCDLQKVPGAHLTNVSSTSARRLFEKFHAPGIGVVDDE